MRLTCILALLGIIVLAGTVAADDPVLRISIPAGFDASKATVVVGQYGNGLGIEQARRERGTPGFTARIVTTTTSVKVLIYYPGCKLVTAEIQRSKLSTPFVPEFEKLPTVPITIQLTGSDGQPIGGQFLSLRQSPVDMEYFHYSDGMLVSADAAPVASGTADAEGNLSLQVPILLDDPLYAKLKVKPGYSIRSDWKSPAGLNDYDLIPSYIDAQRSYAAPVVIKLAYRGKISGRIAQSFLTSRGVSAKLGPDDKNQHYVWFEVQNAGGAGGQEQGIAADGTFSVSVAPGKYDLSVQVRDKQGSVSKSIPIQKDFVVGENQEEKIDLR